MIKSIDVDDPTIWKLFNEAFQKLPDEIELQVEEDTRGYYVIKARIEFNVFRGVSKYTLRDARHNTEIAKQMVTRLFWSLCFDLQEWGFRWINETDTGIRPQKDNCRPPRLSEILQHPPDHPDRWKAGDPFTVRSYLGLFFALLFGEHGPLKDDVVAKEIFKIAYEQTCAALEVEACGLAYGSLPVVQAFRAYQECQKHKKEERANSVLGMED